MKFVFALLICLCATVAAAAQAPAPGATEISPTKRALIKELYAAMKVGESAEKYVNILLDQLGERMPGMISQALGDSIKVRGKDREAIEQAVAESSERVLKRMKELIPQRINFAELTEQIFLPAYDKHFTEQEIKDLVAFYKSPTGQKSIEVMPDLVKESMGKAIDLMGPKMTTLINDALDEEKMRLLKK